MPSRNLALWVGKPYDNDAIFDADNPIDPDKRWAPVQYLRRAVEAGGGWCHTQDVCLKSGLVPDAVLFMDIPSMPVNWLLGKWAGKVKKYVLLQECEVVLPRNWDKRLHEQFDGLFTWSPALADGGRYSRVNFSNIFPAGPAPEGAREKFCVMIAGNKKKTHQLELYSERENTIRWFERNHPGDFDLYGVGWDRRTFSGPLFMRALNRIGPLTRLLAPKFPSYRGLAAQKRELLRQYKFSICYENAREIPGYVTEKIFDCLFAGCVPVYWGAPDITEYVPQDCFIDRRNFNSHEELYAFLKAMPEAELAARRAAIAAYLAGERGRPFTADYFAQTIAGRVLNG